MTGLVFTRLSQPNDPAVEPSRNWGLGFGPRINANGREFPPAVIRQYHAFSIFHRPSSLVERLRRACVSHAEHYIIGFNVLEKMGEIK
jgi:hypothetical protein